MARYVEEEPLKNYQIDSFVDGYNSFSGSKLLIKKTEIPQGATNVTIDENGSATKRAGKSRYGAELSSGHALFGLGRLKNSSNNKVIAASNTAWYNITSSTSTVLTGMTFTADKPTRFCQAIDRLYGANNTDNLAYTTNGSTITEVTANGNIGDWPVFFNQRIYMTNATFADRIYYSNSYSIDLTTNPPTLTTTDFGTFNTDLTATPDKNAGYITLLPGGGVEIVCLKSDNQQGTDYLFVYTKGHGVWRIGVAANNADGSLAHTVTQFVPVGDTPSGLSVIKHKNDQWSFNGYNVVTLGEVATFQTSRLTAKGGRVKAEADSIAAAGKSLVVGGSFKDKVYYAYQTGSYNDRVITYNSILNAWDPPYTNWNVSCFLVHTEDDGTQRFLAGSSNSGDSFVYELETGQNDQGAAISAMFETKSTDCEKPGLVKYFAFIDVFYGSLFGTLTYEVFIDEVSSITGSLQIGNSSDRTAGISAFPLGTKPLGAEYDPDATFTSLAQNDSFRIDCGYTEGKRISVRFTNAVTGEAFKINGISIWYSEGSIYQE